MKIMPAHNNITFGGRIVRYGVESRTTLEQDHIHLKALLGLTKDQIRKVSDFGSNGVQATLNDYSVITASKLGIKVKSIPSQWSVSIADAATSSSLAPKMEEVLKHLKQLVIDWKNMPI